jgi:hypothetical protein
MNVVIIKNSLSDRDIKSYLCAGKNVYEKLSCEKYDENAGY